MAQLNSWLEYDLKEDIKQFETKNGKVMYTEKALVHRPKWLYYDLEACQR